jgi:hypothetical protein
MGDEDEEGEGEEEEEEKTTETKHKQEGKEMKRRRGGRRGFLPTALESLEDFVWTEDH